MAALVVFIKSNSIISDGEKVILPVLRIHGGRRRKDLLSEAFLSLAKSPASAAKIPSLCSEKRVGHVYVCLSLLGAPVCQVLHLTNKVCKGCACVVWCSFVGHPAKVFKTPQEPHPRSFLCTRAFLTGERSSRGKKLQRP